MLKPNGKIGKKNQSYFCHPCGEIVPLHRKPPKRCGKCLQGYIEKVDKNLLIVGEQQPEERISQPAFDITPQPNPSLLVNQFGVIVNPTEIENKARLEKSKIKSQFPGREATSDITNLQVSLQTYTILY